MMQDATAQATLAGNSLVQKCIALGKELRGIDLLAEHVRRIRRTVEQLEAQVDHLL
jgi:hypothetical protein